VGSYAIGIEGDGRVVGARAVDDIPMPHIWQYLAVDGLLVPQLAQYS
jgi:hypothetical protein